MRDENINTTPSVSTPGNAENTSGSTKLNEFAKSTKLQEDTAAMEPAATTSQNTGLRSTLEQDMVILQVTEEEDQEFSED